MRWIGLAILGIGGVAALIALGLWQLDRLDQKSDDIARIEANMDADPVPLPADPDAEDEFLTVAVAGTVAPGQLRFVHSATEYGLVVPLDTDQGTILADVGLTPAAQAPDLAGQTLRIIGNLADPQGRDGMLRTEQPNAWNQRNVAAMSSALGTDPVLVVAQSLDPQPDGVRPFPITTDGIPNNHLGYAIQWFAIACAWAGMTVLLGWRMAGRHEQGTA